MLKRHIFIFMLMIMVCFCFGGCTSTSDSHKEISVSNQDNDPFERVNRGIFTFNQAADKAVLKPVAKGYRWAVPDFVRSGISNVFDTLKQPAYFLNALLQGSLKDAGAILGRTGVNLTFGCLGLFDVASEMNIPAPDNDFGQTLAKWGWHNEGPMIMLPLLGPSSPRDVIGLGVDTLVNPLDWRLRHEPLIVYGMTAVEGFAKREQVLDLLDNLEKSSTDYYAAMRTMYRQNRQKKVNKVLPQEDKTITYDFDFEIDEEDE